MPSSFTRVLPNAFGCSPSTPVSDCGTGRRVVPAGLFAAEDPGASRSNAVGLAARGFLAPRPPLHRRPPRIVLAIGCGDINPLSIGYALGPRLRSRLTLGGLTFPRKPCAFGGWASHPSCRYSFRHTHSPPLHRSSRSGFTAGDDALLPSRERSATAARRLSPRHFRRGMARPVSCYALLKWWLLLSQHPGCLGDPTSFITERRFGGLGRRSGLFPSRARSLSPAL